MAESPPPGWPPLPGTYVRYRGNRYFVRQNRRIPRQTVGHVFDLVFDLVGPGGRRLDGVELSELSPFDPVDDETFELP